MNLYENNEGCDLLVVDVNSEFENLTIQQLANKRLVSYLYRNQNLQTYNAKTSTLYSLNPIDPTTVNLLKPDSVGEFLVVHSVWFQLPSSKQTKKNLKALRQCCYQASTEFSVIAAKYKTPKCVIPSNDLVVNLQNQSRFAGVF